MNVYTTVRIKPSMNNDKGRTNLVCSYIERIRTYASGSGVMGKDGSEIDRLICKFPEIKIYRWNRSHWNGGYVEINPSKLTRKHKRMLRKWLNS